MYITEDYGKGIDYRGAQTPFGLLDKQDFHQALIQIMPDRNIEFCFQYFPKGQTKRDQGLAIARIIEEELLCDPKHWLKQMALKVEIFQNYPECNTEYKTLQNCAREANYDAAEAVKNYCDFLNGMFQVVKSEFEKEEQYRRVLDNPRPIGFFAEQIDSLITPEMAQWILTFHAEFPEWLPEIQTEQDLWLYKPITEIGNCPYRWSRIAIESSLFWPNVELSPNHIFPTEERWALFHELFGDSNSTESLRNGFTHYWARFRPYRRKLEQESPEMTPLIQQWLDSVRQEVEERYPEEVIKSQLKGSYTASSFAEILTEVNDRFNKAYTQFDPNILFLLFDWCDKPLNFWQGVLETSSLEIPSKSVPVASPELKSEESFAKDSEFIYSLNTEKQLPILENNNRHLEVPELKGKNKEVFDFLYSDLNSFLNIQNIDSKFFPHITHTGKTDARRTCFTVINTALTKAELGLKLRTEKEGRKTSRVGIFVCN